MSDINELILAGVDYRLHTTYTSIPCVIVNIRNINEQRVDVQPLINAKTPDGTYREQAVILSVPVMFPSSSTSAFTFKISVGDTVFCHFSQRCIDSFKAGDGRASKPLDLRKFDKRDAVAVPGLSPFSKAVNNPTKHKWPHNPNDTVIVHNLGKGTEVEIRLKEDGTLTINTSSEVILNCSKATVNAPTTINGALTVNGNINSSATITATTDVIGGGKSLKTHVHSGVQSGGSSTAPPT